MRLALVLSMLACAIAFAVLLPPSTPWLRGLAAPTCGARSCLLAARRLHACASRFESGARDLMFQINALADRDRELQRDTLRWLFAVLEVGHAVIDLRRELAALPPTRAMPRSMPWRAHRAIARALTALFERPHETRFDARARRDQSTRSPHVQQIARSHSRRRAKNGIGCNAS